MREMFFEGDIVKGENFLGSVRGYKYLKNNLLKLIFSVVIIDNKVYYNYHKIFKIPNNFKILRGEDFLEELDKHFYKKGDIILILDKHLVGIVDHDIVFGGFVIITFSILVEGLSHIYYNKKFEYNYKYDNNIVISISMDYFLEQLGCTVETL